MEDIEHLFDSLDSVTNDVLNDVEHSITINETRKVKEYLRDIDPLKDYPEKSFKMKFRFTKNVVLNVILPLILQDLRTETCRGLPISPSNQLLIALRFYATASFQIVCADLMNLSQSTVCHIVKKVSRALANQMNSFVRLPTTEYEIRQVKERFECLGRLGRYSGLTDIIGALDCTHIKISKPRGIEHTEQYRNRKGYFSLNVQVVGGPDLKIYDIVVRWAGSTHDSRIYRNSRLHLKLQSNRLIGLLVADAGYPCTRNLLTPLSHPNTPAEERFNKCQIKTRNCIERLFGVWKRRFPCLQKGLGTKLRTTANIIIACAVLHNIAIRVQDEIDELENIHIEASEPSGTSVATTSDGMVLRSNIIMRDFS